MTKVRRPEWPKELNIPFWISPAAAPAHVPFGALAAGADGFAEQERSEVQRRIRAVAKQVGCKNPESWNEEWADLIRGVCNYWNIPGFHPPKKRTTKQIWTNHKLCELFADVHSLTIAGRQITKSKPSGSCGAANSSDIPIKKRPLIETRPYSAACERRPSGFSTCPHRRHSNVLRSRLKPSIGIMCI
jgi:hypothetical protein